MKALFIASICVLTMVGQSKAQPKKPGAIQFESSFDPSEMAAANGIKLSEQVLARMPKSSVSNFELLFNLTNASYMVAEDIEDSNTSSGGQQGLRFGGFGGSNKDYYYNFAEHKLTEAFDLNDTTFLMDAKLGQPLQIGLGPQQAAPVIEYVKTDETKKILGFTCHKTIIKTTMKRKVMDEEKEITDQTTIWFTDELGFDFSPNPAYWTSGAVLAVEGRGTHIYAKSIEFRNVSARDVNLPKKATLITQEQYRQKMEARRKQFRGNRNGGGGQVRTITIN